MNNEDTLKKICKHLEKDDNQRDAIHIAVLPTEVYDDRLYPGEEVGLISGKATINAKKIGIIDPFLKKPVFEGTRCFIFLFPGSIKSLYHVWEHEDIEPQQQPSVEDSKAWLEEHAKIYNISYDDLIESGKLWHETGRHTDVRMGSVPNEHYDQIQLFWTHFQIVTGIKVDNKDDTFFVCSC